MLKSLFLLCIDLCGSILFMTMELLFSTLYIGQLLWKLLMILQLLIWDYKTVKAKYIKSLLNRVHINLVFCSFDYASHEDYACGNYKRKFVWDWLERYSNRIPEAR